MWSNDKLNETTKEMESKVFHGGVFYHPQGWLEADFDDPTKADKAMVMEVMHVDAPHIFFFSEKGINDFTEEDEKRLKETLIKTYPGMEKIYEDEIICVNAGSDIDDGVFKDSKGNFRTCKEWEKAPVVGYFNINPSRWNEKTPGPYGAYVKKK